MIREIERLDEALRTNVPGDSEPAAHTKAEAEKLAADSAVALDELPLDDRSPLRALHRRHAGGDVERQRRVVLQQAAHLEPMRQSLPRGGRGRRRGIH